MKHYKDAGKPIAASDRTATQPPNQLFGIIPEQVESPAAMGLKHLSLESQEQKDQIHGGQTESVGQYKGYEPNVQLLSKQDIELQSTDIQSTMHEMRREQLDNKLPAQPMLKSSSLTQKFTSPDLSLVSKTDDKHSLPNVNSLKK